MTETLSITEAARTAVLRRLFERWAGEPCAEMAALGAHGSSRQYYRLAGATRRCIGTWGNEVRENKAFVAYAQHFAGHGLPVPEVFAVDESYLAYLQQDLGDTTLFAHLYDRKRAGGGYDAHMMALYRKVLAHLADFQTVGRQIDFDLAYPRSDFDRQSIQWDLNYFKYFFLKLANIQFDEELLERDFDTFANHLLEADTTYFMYRDFQPRNIMLTAEGELYYIDFQGGRRGAAQYDVASLLYSARSEMPQPLRRELLRHYMDVRGMTAGERAEFERYFYSYVLVRIMQAMGAYGYRGFVERKEHFIKSLPPAIDNLRYVLENHCPDIEMPHLAQVLRAIVDSKSCLAPATPQAEGRLVVKVMSFSYKRGLPTDDSGNGGGHVFDCRALPNPGRYEQYRAYTGKDLPVVQFLQREEAVTRFLDNAKDIVSQSVEKYMERRFTSLMVCFGCTGGQHRSVYCAEQLARYIGSNFDCDVQLVHREQDLSLS